jgi:ribosomal protein S16
VRKRARFTTWWSPTAATAATVATAHEENLRIDLERVDFWLNRGARPSERVAALLKASRKAPEQKASEQK